MNEPARNSEAFEKKMGGGCMMLFGLPFLLAGLGVMGSALFGGATKGLGPTLGMCAFGAVFALVGGCFVFGRYGIVLDKRRNMLIRWKGFLVPMIKKEYPLDACDAVLLKKEIRRSDKSTYTVYPVSLQMPTENVTVEEPRQLDKGRALSEELSKFLDLPVCDSTLGTETIRQAGTMDMSLRDQLAASGETVEVPEQPEEMTSTISFNPRAKEVVIEIPPSKASGGAKFALLIPLISLVGMFFFIYYFMSGFGGGNSIFTAVFIGFFVIFSIVPFLAFVTKLKGGSSGTVKITANPSSITLENVRGSSKKSVTIPSDEVEEMFLSSGAEDCTQRPTFMAGLSGKGIIVRSDKESLVFGPNLSEEEAIYIQALLKTVLTS